MPFGRSCPICTIFDIIFRGYLFVFGNSLKMENYWVSTSICCQTPLSPPGYSLLPTHSTEGVAAHPVMAVTVRRQQWVTSTTTDASTVTNTSPPSYLIYELLLGAIILTASVLGSHSTPLTTKDLHYFTTR